MTHWIAITAAGSDIGKVVTEHLLDQGFGIIGLGRSNTIAYLESLDIDKLHAIACDYTDEASMEAAFAQAREKVDAIAGLIHLVGGSLVSTPLDELNLGTFEKVMAVNTSSTFLAGREAVRWMKNTGGGNIIFFGSTTGIEPSSGKLAYGVAKAAVHNMTKSFALEASQYEILTNTIAPAYVMTERHINEINAKAEKKAVDKKELLKQLGSKNPLHRILETDQLLGAVDLLLSTKVIQGQVLSVDLGQVGI